MAGEIRLGTPSFAADASHDHACKGLGRMRQRIRRVCSHRRKVRTRKVTLKISYRVLSHVAPVLIGRENPLLRSQRRESSRGPQDDPIPQCSDRANHLQLFPSASGRGILRARKATAGWDPRPGASCKRFTHGKAPGGLDSSVRRSHSYGLFASDPLNGLNISHSSKRLSKRSRNWPRDKM